MSTARTVVTTTRSCTGRLVPTGDPVEVPKDAFVTLTQNLGGTYTIVLNGNMVRLDAADADVIGLTPHKLTFDAPLDDTVSRDSVFVALSSVYDPEIPVNIVDLGLIYDVAINASAVHVDMTLTSPGCGMGPVLIEDVKSRVGSVPNVTDVVVDLVFDPPWSRDRMSEEAQLELGIF